MREFKSIQELLDYRGKCFCGSEMSIRFSHFSSIRCYCIAKKGKTLKNSLIFDVTSNCVDLPDYYKVKFKFIVNIFTNKVKFIINKNSYKNDKLFCKNDFLKFFDSISPRIEIYCGNKNCKIDYIVESSYLQLSEDMKNILPFSISAELIDVDGYFIENDFHYGKCSVGLSSGVRYPIEVDNIDISNLTTSQLLRKVKMIINFS